MAARALLLAGALLAGAGAGADKLFLYNNTYQYDTNYTITLNLSTEYILEFVEDTGDRSLHPARVTVSSGNANSIYPLFITAGQQKGVFSWQLPMIVETAKTYEEFNSMSRTLCPDDAKGESSALNRPLIHLTTSSPTNITTTIKVNRVTDFYIRPSNGTGENPTVVTITPSEPKYYFYTFDDLANTSKVAKEVSKWHGIPKIPSPKSVVLIIESDDDVCATVSIQNYSCPVFDNERDILYGGYYLTMMRKGGITLTQEMFPVGFYIVLLVKESDEECVGPNVNESAHELQSAGWHYTESEYSVATRGHGRVKNLRLTIIATISYKEYIIAASLAFAFFLSFYFLFAATSLFCRKRRLDLATQLLVDPEEDILAETEYTHLEEESSHASGRNQTNGEGTSTHPAETLVLEDSISDTNSEYSDLHDTEHEKDIYRLPVRLTLASLARKKAVILTGRSDRYLWSVLTISVFYALPVVQLVITYQGILKQTGDQDLCYYNFLCAHPLGLLSDFNHVYSNLGYVLLGVLFLVQVTRRHYNATQCANNQNCGIPQHYGLFYSMGTALVMEGVLSGSYHFCPNKMNFQFDSSFMYVIAVLCMVKIYQTRHPDINARAHSTFGVLACILFIGLSGILSSQDAKLNLYFWISFTILHLVVCLVLTFQIYYMGRFKFDRGMARRIWQEVRRSPAAAVRPHYRGRFILLILANLANWALAAYGVYLHKMDFAVHLLAILMGNTILYTLFYIVMKLLSKERIKLHAWFFILATHLAWFSSLYFFLHSRTKWSLTPAQSRRFNQECDLLDFYDYHDIWHFLSAIALFLSFNLLLTLDDGLSRTPRSEISVF